MFELGLHVSDYDVFVALCVLLLDAEPLLYDFQPHFLTKYVDLNAISPH